MSLLERKLSNVLLFNAFDDLKSQQVHNIPISTLSEISGYGSNDTKTLKVALKNLKQISIDWDLLDDDGKEDWGSFSLLAGVRFKGGVCYYEYPSMLAEKLAEPEVYGSINIGMQKQFISKFTLVIYEICSRSKGLLKGNKGASTKWMTLHDFKKMLGVEDSEFYSQFKELNRKIIKPSVHEINGTLKKYQGTDIFIEPEYKRLSRNVSDIRFKIRHNPQFQLPLEKDENDELRKTGLYKKLRDRGLSDKGALHSMLAYESDYLEEKILLVDEAEKAGKVKTSVGGLLSSAIDNDYQPAKKKSEAQEKADQQKLKDEARAKQEQEKAEQLSLLKNDLSKEIRDEYIATLSEAEKVDLLAQLKETQAPVMRKKITTLSHILLIEHIQKQIPDFDEKLAQKLKDK